MKLEILFIGIIFLAQILGFTNVIEITKANHLDSNKKLISNIYEEVRSLDNTWSEPIYHNEYIRVSFEIPLTKENDITIYVRDNAKTESKVEVYKQGSNNKITEFPIIRKPGYYRVLLTDMVTPAKNFDLKIVNTKNNEKAYLEFDHIIDPTSNLTVTACDVGDAANTGCFDAISADGGTSYDLAKNAHIDAPFQTLSTADTVTSATLFYDADGTLGGTWRVRVTDTRDGTIICEDAAAGEGNSETRYSLACDSVTPAQLNTGVWFYALNEDSAAPESITIDYVYFYVDYTEATSSCTYGGSGNYIIDCLDNCRVTTNVGLDRNNLSFINNGTIFIDANISDFTRISFNESCMVAIEAGQRLG